VQSLVEMGIAEADARAALVSCGNSVEQAIDLVFNNVGLSADGNSFAPPPPRLVRTTAQPNFLDPDDDPSPTPLGSEGQPQALVMGYLNAGSLAHLDTKRRRGRGRGGGGRRQVLYSPTD
jgi:hypothetical protein